MDCIGTGRRKKRPESILNLAQGGRSGNPVWRIFVEWTIRKPEPGQWQSLNHRKCCQLFPVGPLTRHESTYEREDSFRHFIDPEPLKPFCYSTCQKVTFLFFSPSLPSHHSNTREVRSSWAKGRDLRKKEEVDSTPSPYCCSRSWLRLRRWREGLSLLTETMSCVQRFIFIFLPSWHTSQSSEVRWDD